MMNGMNRLGQNAKAVLTYFWIGMAFWGLAVAFVYMLGQKMR